MTPSSLSKNVGSNEVVKLAGAQFALMSANGRHCKYVGATKTEKAKVDGVGSWDDAMAVAAGGNGSASFVGMKDGSRQLKEAVVPRGHNLRPDMANMMIDDADEKAVDSISLIVTCEASNANGLLLPCTGGMGLRFCT